MDCGAVYKVLDKHIRNRVKQGTCLLVKQKRLEVNSLSDTD